MASLSVATAPPRSGCITVSQTHGELVTCTEERAEQDDLLHLDGYPRISVQPTKPYFEGNEDHMLVVARQSKGPVIDALDSWRDGGVMEALGTLSERCLKDGKVPWYAYSASALLACVRYVSSLHGSFYPHLLLSDEDMLGEFSDALDWSTAPVRAIAWHPHAARLAIARKDNVIQMFHVSQVTSSSSKYDSMRQLKHCEQRRISCLAWRPFSGSVLAAGCQTGVLLWHVSTQHGSPRPYANHLSSPGHTPVVSISWSPSGQFLASACPADTAIMIWDVLHGTCTPLRRYSGGGVSLVRWSPSLPADGRSRLLAATPSNSFRVWETALFTCERWSNLAGRIKAACWSPNGEMLLFATKQEAAIYSLHFFVPNSLGKAQRPSVGGAEAAVKCADLSQIEFSSSDESELPASVGGFVQSMAWDHSGEQLAVVFSDDSPGRDLVALFRTRLHPVFEIIPSGFVRGMSGELPQVISFQQDIQQGAVLAIAWSSGRVQFLPFVYANPSQADHLAQDSAGARHSMLLPNDRLLTDSFSRRS